MTQGYPANPDHGAPLTGNGAGAAAAHPPDEAGADAGQLLEQVRGTVSRLLADTPRAPRTLRVQAGEVSLELGWDTEPAAPPPAPTSETTGSAPAGPDRTGPDRTGPDQNDPDAFGDYLTAQTVGVFYRAPEPGAAPFVSEGDTVIPGQQVGIIEAMKLMIPVEADRAGRIVAVLKDNAEPVEYGDRLFALTTAGPA